MNNAPNTTSLSDILSAAKNLVIGVNAIVTDYLNVQGQMNAAALSASTLVKASAGRIARISVTTAGSTTGTVYDGATTSAMSKPVYIIPEDVGIYEVNLPLNFGLLVVPGTSQVLTVSYS